jgi:nucleoside kinase
VTGKRVLTTGYPSLDHIARVERLGAPGETRIVEQPWRAATPGGCAANVAVALARLGTRAAACFAVGDDASSARYLEGLQRDGVDVGEVTIRAGESMPQAYLFLDEHDTELYFDPGAMRDWPGPETLDLTDTARVVVTVGPVAATIAIIEHAEKHGIPIALQLKRDLTAFEPDRLRAMLAHCDLLFANREEIGFLLEAVGVRHTSQILSLGPRWIVETRGSEGAVLHHEAGELEVPVVPAQKTVDPTGAGDAFTAGVVFGLMAGAAPVVAARIGAVLASFVVEGWGCQQTLPGREELGERYRDVFGAEKEARWLGEEAM